MNCVDDEEIENNLAEENHIRNSGFLDRAHYELHKRYVVGGLGVFGDSFAISLGHTLELADLNDSLKIMRYWNHLCEQHALLFKMKEAKEKVE
jgi:hypothetical protein